MASNEFLATMPDFHTVPLRLVFLSTICTVSPYRRYANRSECTRRLMELDSYSCVHVSAKLCYKFNCTAIMLGIRGDLRNWQWTEALRTQTTIFYWNCHWDVFSSRIPSWWFSNLIGIEAKKKKTSAALNCASFRRLASIVQRVHGGQLNFVLNTYWSL